ncbi:MAG: hypothetical protein JWL61_2686 [Gemmatimonadetes bacterium]|nr:hypothetical protein [Gemmatimonadota bacterium]
MKRHILFAAGLSMFAVASASAQDLATPVCPPGNTGQPIPNQARAAQDACQQAYDIYQFMAPQLGLALAGGNATLGQGSTLGGLGHFSVGVRANAFQGSLPDIGSYSPSVNGAQKNGSLATKDQWLGLPTADAAIGIFGGIPLPLTNVGGIDALVSASYVPSYSSGTLSVTPTSNFQMGYGLRVGLLSESIIVPGVSFTYLKRDLPTTSISGNFSGGSAAQGSFKVSNVKVNTSAWRAVASKSFLLFSFAAGAGKDMYDQSADISATVNTTIVGLPSATATVPSTTQKLDRTNYFFDASLNLPLFKIVGEIGQVSGGTVQTYNGFSGGRADRSQQYFSAGIRFGI